MGFVVRAALGCLHRHRAIGSPTTTHTSATARELRADRDKIQKCLGSLKNHPVPLTGQVTINENGEALRKPQILVVKDSRFTAVP